MRAIREVLLACKPGHAFVVPGMLKWLPGVRRRVGHERLSEWWVRMLPISYAMFSGMLGTQSVLFCKMLSMLLRTTIQGHSQLASWFTWLIFFLFLGTAFFWVSRLNKVRALRRARTPGFTNNIEAVQGAPEFHVSALVTK